MTEAQKVLEHQEKIAANLDNRPQFNPVAVRDCSAPARDIPVTHENISFAPDQRQARIEAMTDDLEERRKIINIVKRFGDFDKFVLSAIKLEGKIAGMQESFQCAPAPTPPQHSEGEGQ